MFLTWKRLTALSCTFYLQTNTSHLRDTTEAVSASHGVDMTSSLLGASVVSTHSLLPLLSPLHNPSQTLRNPYLLLKGILVT